jgi:amino-acid N-acetyltransferase
MKSKQEVRTPPERGHRTNLRRARATGSQRRAPPIFDLGPATVADGPAIAALLREAKLPFEDIAGHLAHFIIARSRGRIVGAVGAEVNGAVALLRSLVVAPAARGAGLGGRLVEALERAAGAWGVRRWWLLTTTAEAFFARRGFKVVARMTAPAEIQRTGQFQGGCHRAAICMTRERRAR